MRLSFKTSALMGLAAGAPFGLVFGRFLHSFPIGMASGALFGALFVLAIAVVFVVTDEMISRRMARLERETVKGKVLFRASGSLRVGRRAADGIIFGPPWHARILFTRDSLVVIAVDGRKHRTFHMPYRDIAGFPGDDPGALEGKIAGDVRKGVVLTIDASDGVIEVTAQADQAGPGAGEAANESGRK